MSRQQLIARDKITQKNTRDGLVERNEATGEAVRVSRREADVDLRGETPGGEAFSQHGKRLQAEPPQVQSAKHRQVYRHYKTESTDKQIPDGSQETAKGDATRIADIQQASTYPAQTDIDSGQAADAAPENTHIAETPEHAAKSDGGRVPQASQGAKGKPPQSTRQQYEYFADSPAVAGSKPTPDMAAGTPRHTHPSADNTVAQPKNPPVRNPVSAAPDAQTHTASSTQKPGKLQFTQDEATPDLPKISHDRKLAKAERQASSTARKLDKARSNLPRKRKLRSERVLDEKSGVSKRKLYFESKVKPQAEHIKGPLPLRPVKAAGNSALIFGHRKLYQAEHDNTGLKAAHRVETVAEGGVRSALRLHKTAPYRKVAKLERKSVKKSINLTYQQAIAQNPKLKSSLIKRALQKRKIKKDYAKAAREAQKAAKKAKKAGSAAVDIGKAVIGVVKRHPVASTVIILISLLVFSITSFSGAFGGIGGGSSGVVAASTYLAADTEIYAAETAYSGMEAALQYEVNNYAALHPGYDEYLFDLDSIWHDPYVLTSILSAFYEGAWTLGDVQGMLALLFEQQYILTETITTETRYRKEPTEEIDPVTGEAIETLVPYDYNICTVTLVNKNLSHLPIEIMGEDRLSRFALYTASFGNRPDLFPVSAYPNASFFVEYGRHDIPKEYLNDATFAAIIKEAEKWLGMPYIWGGYSPAVSFDCSGFVSWVLNHSGWDIGRLGAQGLYNISVPVSASDARPGDLVFFHSTYKAPGVTHVGIYVGDGYIIHAGHPVGYASIDTDYWRQHLYAYGRIYN